jgi:hypothetical protein
MTAGKEPIAVSELPTDVALKPFTRYVNGPLPTGMRRYFPETDLVRVCGSLSTLVHCRKRHYTITTSSILSVVAR